MEKIRRNERMSAMMKILSASPNRIFTLSYFCDMFGAAKSTMSEDIDILRDVVKTFQLGELETVTGAAGGVRYRARVDRSAALDYINSLCDRLSGENRVLPGSFLYYSDILSSPQIVQRMGEILATEYYDLAPDFVLTMETKGIPIALMTARMLDVPLVIARRDSRAYEGSAVKINYIAGGGNERIETMALARRAVAPGQRALIIDDFMKGGGTLQGMVDMMKEFQAEVVGVGVMIATSEPQVKRVEGARSLLVLEGFEPDTGRAIIHPSKAYL